MYSEEWRVTRFQLHLKPLFMHTTIWIHHYSTTLRNLIEETIQCSLNMWRHRKNMILSLPSSPDAPSCFIFTATAHWHQKMHVMYLWRELHAKQWQWLWFPQRTNLKTELGIVWYKYVFALQTYSRFECEIWSKSIEEIVKITYGKKKKKTMAHNKMALLKPTVNKTECSSYYQKVYPRVSLLVE